MNPRAEAAVEATVTHLQNTYGPNEDRLEMLESILESYRLMQPNPEKYVTEPELLPYMIEAAVFLIAFEKDRRAGRIQ